MRRFVYKNEIEHIFNQHEIVDAEKNRIKTELFIRPFRDFKQLHLNSEIIEISHIESALNKNGNSEIFITEFKSLFEVDEDLKMPSDLKNLFINNYPIAVFIGAGVSRLLDYPSWDQLAYNAIDFLLKKGKINHSELQKINNEINDPKQKLSIFDKICSKKSKLGKEFFRKAFKKPSIEPIENPYKYLVSRNFNWLKITSNIEYELLKAFLEENISELKEKEKLNEDEKRAAEIPKEEEFKKNRLVSKNFDPDNINSEKLYYLHGELDNIEETIFTTEDYIEKYFSSSDLRSFLEKIFDSYTVIFIGYGLAELPILERVMKQKTNPHYALIDTFFNETNIFQIKENYYRQFNIVPIPYYKDFKGYNRLVDVLKSWERELQQENLKRSDSKNYFDNLNFLDELIK